MRDIKVKILADGTAQVEEPFCFCGEHNAARLCRAFSVFCNYPLEHLRLLEIFVCKVAKRFVERHFSSPFKR